MKGCIPFDLLWKHNDHFLAELLTGCPSFEEFVSNPLSIQGRCYGTRICAVSTTVKYLCEEFNPLRDTESTCTANYTWYHHEPLEACTPTGESNSIIFTCKGPFTRCGNGNAINWIPLMCGKL